MAGKRRHQKRIIKTNPDEPRAGEFAYSFYDAAHPLYGDEAEIKRIKKALAGLRGERVTVRIQGKRVDADGETHYFTRQRTVNYRNYRDIFGPGSAFASGMHAEREAHSGDELSVTSIEFDTDYEDDEDDY